MTAPSLALLQVPSGRVVERIPLTSPDARVIEHAGSRWLRSHQGVSGVVFIRERQRASEGQAPGPTRAATPRWPVRRAGAARAR